MARFHARIGIRLALVLIALAGCYASGVPATSRSRRTESSSSGSRSVERRDVIELAQRVNRRRGAVGCPALIWDDRIAAVAQRHSEDMARRGYFDHTNLRGKDPFDRLHDAGIEYRAAAENLAEGYPDARKALEGWLRSRGHRANLDNCAFTHHGIGLYQNRWTHLFVRYPEQRR